MLVLVNSGLHLATWFQVVAHDLDFVLIVVTHFDKETRSVKYSSGKVIIKLDVELLDTIFRCPYVEEYVDISFESY